MNRYDFLKVLKEALEGEVSPNIIHENINFYEGYINNEISQGSTEAEVLDSLGDPRLIARTIIETSGSEDSGFTGNTYYTESGNGNFDTPPEERGGSGRRNLFFYNNSSNKWLGRLIAAAAIILPIVVIGLVFLGITSILFRFSGPILVIFIVYMVVRTFRK